MKPIKILLLVLFLSSCSEKEIKKCNPEYDCQAFGDHVKKIEERLSYLKENEPSSDSLQWYEDAAVNWKKSYKEFCGGCEAFIKQKKEVPNMAQHNSEPIFLQASLCPPWWSFGGVECCPCRPILDYNKAFVYSSESLRLSIDRCNPSEIHPSVTRIIRQKNIGTVTLFSPGGVPIYPNQIGNVWSWGAEDCTWVYGDYQGRFFNYSFSAGRMEVVLEKVLLGHVDPPTTTGTEIGYPMPGGGDKKTWYIYP